MAPRTKGARATGTGEVRPKVVDLDALKAERARLWSELLTTAGPGTELKRRLTALYRLENRLLRALGGGR